ncbi:MAG: sigma-70 family RNA polymerase sigma factor [bacterium]|nr:sigma-70 family RNA polymerase sigma factor [bacterium]
MDAREADELAGRARDGDPLALTRLYEAFAPALLAFVIRLTGDRAAAEDVIHDVFLRLIEKRGRLDARGRFRQWLFVVAANEARTRLRQGRRFRDLDSDACGIAAKTTLATAPDSPEGDLEHRECLALIEQVLAQLPPGYAEAFHLRVREGFGYGEMAAITGEPEGTLRSRVHHSLTSLRAKLIAAGAHRAPMRGRKGTRP